jgi:hypothetical protein
MSNRILILSLAACPLFAAGETAQSTTTPANRCEQAIPSTLGNAKTVGAETARNCFQRADDHNAVGNAKTVGANSVAVYVETPQSATVGNSKTVGGR